MERATQQASAVCIARGCGKTFDTRKPETRSQETLRPFWASILSRLPRHGQDVHGDCGADRGDAGGGRHGKQSQGSNANARTGRTLGNAVRH